MGRSFVAVTNSVRDESDFWNVPEVPFHCRVGSDGGFVRRPRGRDLDRVEFLAREKNLMMEEALRRFPAASHVLCVESWYLGYADSIRRLMRMYETIGDDDLILAAPIWYDCRTRLKVGPRTFYDGWAFPELDELEEKDFPAEFVQVSSAGSCFIFPVRVWKEYRFVNPRPFSGQGFFYNNLCWMSGLPVLVWRGAPVYRVLDYGLFKRLRCSVGSWRRRWLGF